MCSTRVIRLQEVYVQEYNGMTSFEGRCGSPGACCVVSDCKANLACITSNSRPHTGVCRARSVQQVLRSWETPYLLYVVDMPSRPRLATVRWKRWSLRSRLQSSRARSLSTMSFGMQLCRRQPDSLTQTSHDQSYYAGSTCLRPGYLSKLSPAIPKTV